MTNKPLSTMTRTLLILLALILPVAAQNGAWFGQSFGVNPFSPGAGATPSPIFLPFSQVRVCLTSSLIIGTPCTPVAVIFDLLGNPLTIPPGQFGQITTGVTGAYNFGCNGGTYEVQIEASSSNTPQAQYLFTCPNSAGGSSLLSANNTWTGFNVFSGQPTELSCTTGDCLFGVLATNGVTSTCSQIDSVVSNGHNGELQIRNCNGSPDTTAAFEIVELSTMNMPFSVNFNAPTNSAKVLTSGSFQLGAGVPFVSLPADPNGSMIYCTNCKNVVDDAAVAGAACVAAGSGALARRQNGHWDCN